MSTTHHTLATVSIPRGLIWVDEHDWCPIEGETAYSTTGALLVDVAVKQAGRPITLQADNDAGWMPRTTLMDLHALAAVPGATYLLTLADGREFTVMFVPGNPITATPIARPELPATNHPYVATVRLIEV